MTQVFLNEEQANTVRQATGGIEVLDPSGVVVGYVTRPGSFTAEEIAEAGRRLSSDGPWHTTEEVVRHLQAMEQG